MPFLSPTATAVLPDKVEKRQARYHFHVLLQGSRQELDDLLCWLTAKLQDMPLPGDTRFAIEVDPLSLH